MQFELPSDYVEFDQILPNIVSQIFGKISADLAPVQNPNESQTVLDVFRSGLLIFKVCTVAILSLSHIFRAISRILETLTMPGLKRFLSVSMIAAPC